MTWEAVAIGGVLLRESQVANLDDGTLALSGREMSTITTAAQVAAAQSNVSQLANLTVPVVFQGKAHLSGYYRVDRASAFLRRIAEGQLLIAEWSANLVRVGTEHDVEFKSRVPTIARTTEVAGAPAAAFWHAPPPGTLDYFTGPTIAFATTSRGGSEGEIVVRRDIPTDVALWWTVPAADYLRGSARVLLDGIRRIGTATPTHESWSVSNSLLNVRSTAGAAFEVSVVAADGSLKSTKGWAPTVNSAALSSAPEFTILRNDPEEVVVRLSYPQTTGRMTVDLSLRRGARFITGVIKRYSAATLGVARTATEAATAATGGLRATSADEDGNRFVVGSARTTVAALSTAGISKATTTVLDFFIGHEVGASPASGDAFTDLFAQYLGTQSERVQVLPR